MYNPADQPQDPTNDRSDNSSAAMASFVQELYSSASRELAAAASRFTSGFMLNDLEIEDNTTSGDDTTGNEDKVGDSAKLAKTEVPNDKDSEPAKPSGSDKAPNLVESTRSKAEIDAEKDARGLDKGTEFQKDTMKSSESEAEAKLNERGKSSKEKSFTKQDLLKEFEKAGGTNTLGDKTEEPSPGGKDKSSNEGREPKGNDREEEKKLQPQHNGSSNSKPEK